MLAGGEVVSSGGEVVSAGGSSRVSVEVVAASKYCGRTVFGVAEQVEAEGINVGGVGSIEGVSGTVVVGAWSSQALDKDADLAPINDEKPSVYAALVAK